MIRPYRPSDKEKLLLLLRLNTPAHFAPSEESDFINYLDNETEDYFLLEKNGKIIGCGGINYLENGTIARISWDIVHPDYQGKGIGKKLTFFRLAEIRKNPAVRRIEVRTSQLAYRFYQKMGFELERIEQNFWAEGFDLYQMKMEPGQANETAGN